jgi:hypothetical protein
MQCNSNGAKHNMVIPKEESLGLFSEIKDDEMDYGAKHEFFENKDKNKEDGSFSEWFKEWPKREQVSEKVKMIAKQLVINYGATVVEGGILLYLISVPNGRILN